MFVKVGLGGMVNDVLKYGRRQYDVDQLNKLDETDIRDEYTRLRRIYLKRIKALKKAGYGDSKIVLYHSEDKYPTLTEIKSDRQLKFALSGLADFVSRRTSTVTGIKAIQKDTVTTLNRRGYTSITSDNLKDFGRYMEEARDRSVSRFFDSVRAAEMFDEGYEGGSITDLLEEFAQWEKKQLLERKRMKERYKKL